MHEPSDGIAEEVERQLQLALATAAIAARRAVTARQYAIEQAQRESQHAAQAVKARLDDERMLAAARLQPVFNPGWWETARPQDVADMWQAANSWPNPDRPAASPTIFDQATGRIRQEVRDRAGLDPTQVLALAAVQELERETLTQPGGDRTAAETPAPDLTTPHGFDDPQRRERLRTRLVAAGVPEAAIQARTLADVGQAHEAVEAARAPVATVTDPRTPAAHRAGRDLRRQR
jgi:hypothetical protein